MRRLLITSLVLFALAGGSALAQSFSSLEERMTAAEFKAAGLEKLTPEELKALNAFLAGKVAVAVPAGVPAADTRGFQSRTTDDGDIISSISGEFTGWDGRGSRITLTNGQVWEVTDSTARLKVRVTDPQVIITPGVLNSWYLRIEGYNTRAKVKRIR
jgi:hypothetical protein